MKISVIIPAHNEEKTISKCLDSVYNQTFKDFECVVVADACTDNTVEVAKSYGAKVVEADVRNDGLSRNIGMENSSGEWILFIDADDWWLHEYVFELLSKRTEDNTCDAICFDMVWKHIGVVGSISGRNNQFFPHCTNKMWRRTFIGGTRFPNVYPDSDAQFHDLIMAKRPHFDVWNMPMYYYNFLRDSSFSQKAGRTAQQAINYWGIDTKIVESPNLRFSIIIPAFNAEGHIRKTLDSIKGRNDD